MYDSAEIKHRYYRNSLKYLQIRTQGIVSISRPAVDYTAGIDYYISVHRAVWAPGPFKINFSSCQHAFIEDTFTKFEEVKAFSCERAHNEYGR